MSKSELKQFGDFTPADFDRHPVWITAHTADYGEPCRLRFRGSMFGVPVERRWEVDAALRRGPEAIFPLRFSAGANLATGVVAGRVDGPIGAYAIFKLNFREAAGLPI